MASQSQDRPSPPRSHRKKNSKSSTNHEHKVDDRSESRQDKLTAANPTLTPGSKHPKKRKRLRRRNSERTPSVDSSEQTNAQESFSMPPSAYTSSKLRLPSPIIQLQSGEFATGDDYIAFETPEEEDYRTVHARIPKGKGRERAPPEPRIGDKRSADQMEYGADGYVNKKQRLDAAARLTPWVDDVHWDGCRNLAEV